MLNGRSIGTEIWETPGGVDFERLRDEIGKVSEAVREGEGGRWRNSDIAVVIVEGFLLFCDAALCRMLDAHIWIETDCGTCALRRRNRGKKRKRTESAEFLQWYEQHTWPRFEKYRTVQLTKTRDALLLDGAWDLAAIAKAAAGPMKNCSSAAWTRPIGSPAVGESTLEVRRRQPRPRRRQRPRRTPSTMTS